ncbi:MAG: hypothetical protein K9K82_01950 [Desulfobacteraceae bacterium]|nr:hypothetical protein [Desulfobacteraceae bacterium]
MMALVILGMPACGEKGSPPGEDTEEDGGTGETVTSGTIESLVLESAEDSVPADTDNQVSVRATLSGGEDADLEGIIVEFTTTAGNFEGSSEATASTNENGVAEVLLTAGTRVGSAHVTASAEGFSDYTTIEFIPGQPDGDNSSITVDPAVIPADGQAEAEVTVTLADENGNPVQDGTSVTLSIENADGTVVSENPTTTSSGRVTYTVRAGNDPGTATLYLLEYPEEIPDAELEFAETEPGEPTSIRVDEVSPKEIAVTGVGENDESQIEVSLVDSSGQPVEGVDHNNLSVSLVARPGGGEYLSGKNSAGETDTNKDNPDESIEISSGSNGTTSFKLFAGRLPGVVEVRIEVVDENGNSLDPAIATVIPQISIASGPPHTIALSAPTLNAIVNLNEETDAGISERPGFYSRRAGLIVTDRYGNAVQDGTVVNLGVIDSVISAGTTGSTSENDVSLSHSDAGVDFMEDFVLRNGVERSIQLDDRVVIFDTEAEDKSRHVAEVNSWDELHVTKPYNNNRDNLEYAVGSSLLGASIYGINEDGEATPGTVRTSKGLASIRLVYPANKDTIFIGNVASDPRHQPAGSARVITVFTCSDSGATLVDEGTLAFSSIAGWNLEATPKSISGSASIELELVDGGDEVPLPFVPISAHIQVTSDAGTLSVSASDCITQHPSGTCTSTINISGAQSGDSATITYYAGDTETEVSFQAP